LAPEDRDLHSTFEKEIPMAMSPTRRNFVLGAGASALLPLAARGAEAADARSAGETAGLPASIAALKDRRQEATPISSAEREARLERARELMQQASLAAVCMTGGTSLRYFSGVHWWPSERLMALVLPAKGQPFAVCPAFEEDRLHEQFALVPSLAATRLLTWQEDDDPYARLAAGLRDLGLAAGAIGIEEAIPFVFAQGIGRALPQATMHSATPVTAGCREVKSPAELALMQLANSVTLQVYEAAWRAGSPGMTTHEFSALVATAYERVGFAGDASCETGPYSALPHGSIQPQTIREGAMVLIDDGCTVEGYQSDISRSFVYGKPSDKMLGCFDTVHRAQVAALAAARPGATCGSVDAAARKVIEDAGFGPGYKYFLHRVGHGIGMDMHEWPYLVRGNPQIIAAHMTFSDEPGIYIPGEFGVRLEDDMHLTEDGAKLFTGPSRSLEQPFG
jgi:Xaa-Pro dipeptidase